MERDMKKIIETLQAHEADNALINDVLVMILNNQIQATKTTKNCLLEIKENIESERTNKNKAIEIIKDFIVDIAERLIVLERKL
tara:strand:+ start:264 stop:515 length:252 start_codon:yes stop_codon:yes gene_type:complete